MKPFVPAAIAALLTLPAPAWAAKAPAGPAATPSPGAVEVAPALPSLQGLRWSADEGEARLTLELPQPVLFEERTTPSAWRLFLPGLSAGPGTPPVSDPVLPQLNARSEAGGTLLEIPWKYWCPTEFALSEDALRLTVTFKKHYQDVEEEALAPGVVHEHRRQADRNGPLNVHVLRVDPKHPGVRLMPGMAKGGAYFSREPVSAIARRYGALAGINGSYFSTKTGEPLGMLMINGQLVSSNLMNRSVLAIAGNGELTIDKTQLSTRLTLASGETYDFDGVNQQRGLNRMVLYTEHYGPTTFTPTGGREYSVLPDGTVLAISDSNAPIPPGGYVISAHGQAAAWLEARVQVGAKLSMKSPLHEFWPGVQHVLGGGPTLLREGRVAISALEEQFKPDITHGLAPRTAVGLTPSGEVLLVTVDGRQPQLSRGLSLAGLAYLLQQLGASEAMNMDGGGSTAMAIGPAIVNRPSDGVERPVNNALLVFAEQAATFSRR